MVSLLPLLHSSKFSKNVRDFVVVSWVALTPALFVLVHIAEKHESALYGSHPRNNVDLAGEVANIFAAEVDVTAVMQDLLGGDGFMTSLVMNDISVGFEHPEQPNERFVERVGGVPGEIVEVMRLFPPRGSGSNRRR